MRNLFICHTQAQLLLASGLALGRFRGDENQLILFKDFALKEDLKERLNKTFAETLYLQSIYPAEFNTIRAKLRWYPKDWKYIKEFLTKPVDRAFAVCDWLFLVQKTLKQAYILNNKVDMAWLEDGITAYYKDSDIHKGMDKYRFTMSIRLLLFKHLLGVGRFYDRDFAETGGLKQLKKAYVCYPSAVREPYRSQRELVAITEEEYLLGLQSMYSKQKLEIQPNSVILVVDKLDRYAFPNIVREALKDYIEKCISEKKTIICKFHPRETDSWEIFNGCTILEKTVGIESVYASLAEIKDAITIAGIKSTGLMSAKKLGFNTVSLFKRSGEDNENLINFYNSLGIEFL